MQGSDKLVKGLSAQQLEDWLDQAGIRHERCGDCDGYHFAELEAMVEGMECRLFFEQDVILISTEMEIRPAAILPAVAETARLNMEFTNLKIFVDLNDQTMPHLVMGDTLSLRAGLTFEQLLNFIQETLNTTQLVIEDCQRMGYLYSDEQEPDTLH